MDEKKTVVDVVAEFIENSQKVLSSQSDPMSYKTLNLDENLCLVVGWELLDFDYELDEFQIDTCDIDKESGEVLNVYALSTSIRTRAKCSKFDYRDLEQLNYPRFKESGEVLDYSLWNVSNANKQVFKDFAKDLISEYWAIQNGIKRGKITIE